MFVSLKNSPNTYLEDLPILSLDQLISVLFISEKEICIFSTNDCHFSRIFYLTYLKYVRDGNGINNFQLNYNFEAIFSNNKLFVYLFLGIPSKISTCEKSNINEADKLSIYPKHLHQLRGSKQNRRMIEDAV